MLAGVLLVGLGGVLAAVLLVGFEVEVDAGVAEALVIGALEDEVGEEAANCSVDVTGVLLGWGELVTARLDEACEAALLADELNVTLDDTGLVAGTEDEVAASELACEVDDDMTACGVEVAGVLGWALLAEALDDAWEEAALLADGLLDAASVTTWLDDAKLDDAKLLGSALDDAGWVVIVAGVVVQI